MAAAFVSHWPCLNARALYFDDDQYLLHNERILHPTWSGAWAFVTEILEPRTVGGYYQPLAMLSLMLDAGTGGSPENLAPFHRTSLILHGLCSVLVFMILNRCFGRPLLCCAVACLFAAHPMTVESVAWISDRKTLLSAFFGLLCILAYVDACLSSARSGGRASRNPTAGRLLVVAAAFVLSLASKPTSVMLPIALLVLDAWPLRRMSRRAVVEKVPLLGIAALFSLVAYVSQARTATVTLPSDSQPLRPMFQVCYATMLYFSHMIWPLGLSSYYPTPDPLSFANPQVLTAVVIIAFLIGLAITLHRKGSPLPWGGVVFVLLLLPAYQIIGFSKVAGSDKYAYFPVIGLLIAICGSGSTLKAKLPLKAARKEGFSAVAMALVLTVILGMATWRYALAWADTETLLRHTISTAPNTASLRTMLANELVRRSELIEAEFELRKAVKIDPGYPPAADKLASLLESRGRHSEAVEVYRRLSQARPDLSRVRKLLSKASDTNKSPN